MTEGVTPDRRGPFCASRPVLGDPPEWQSDIVFTHSLALVLDVSSQLRLDAARQELRRAGAPVLDHPFHITLCCVDTMDGVAGVLPGLELPRRLVLGRAELLPSSSGVIALRPCEDAVGELRAGHRELDERLAGAGVTTFNYYGPSRWQPHVTVGFQVPKALQAGARGILAGHAPVEVAFSGISVWTVGTDELEMLAEL
ncbi:hypothetical protein DUY81_02655 [Acidipropionibacterium acidipropionici]|jgi:hypothetical protein|uniref:2'-5' RNA ligase family protein n=1 Tax=Acidipropionibacterium acidipropionici TaxID=1748 RepID=A0AAC9ANL6_9ACTN|nr:2'-5' RNA ligase family protein [Acidipropionibacterium acidipropionici]AMS05575.1 hypothetical protein AXH35_09090 [Acidipropionibacterium acidipropionici]AOZ47046.1 hypothetical protein A8L58_10530 [Acidipropionibacterium acidipropionici]AZP36859.1 hypothetical protein DUY81_02655 [Acidipropionibacterium acidipropionici]